MSRDDGSWNKWTDPDGVAYHVCHICFTSPRRQWREEFSLYEKASFGTIHMPRGFPVTRTDLEHRPGFVQRYLGGQVPEGGTLQSYQKTEQPYTYSRLHKNQIRILTILPAETNDDLCCNLRHVDIDAAKSLKYEALSYRWEESPETPQTIWIDGCTFVVSHSLFVAMSSLRSSKRSRSIWIDAISINQVNDDDRDDEKKVQISLMGKIYCFAYEVVIWLGPAADGSDNVMDIIASNDVEAMQSVKFADGFHKLLLRSWFYRTWIVQEFVLAKFPPKVVCGTKSITSGQFLAAHAFIDGLEKHSSTVAFHRGLERPISTSSSIEPVKMKPLEMKSMPTYGHAISALVDLRSAALDDEGNLRQRSLAGTLRYYRESQVTDSRDKVYGTLGLLDESVHDFIKADSKNSIAEAYTDAMAYIFNVELEKYDVETLHLFLTYPCSLSLTNPIIDLPSWVPDFSRNHALLNYEFNFTWFWLYQITRSDGRKPFVKLQHGRHRVEIDRVDRSSVKVRDKTLIVKGLAVDEITAIQPSVFYNDFPRDIKSAIEKMFGQSEGGKRVEELLQPLLESLMSISDIKAGESSNLDPQLVLANIVRRMGQAIVLHNIEEICRQQMNQLESNTSPDEWMSFIWRDLFEGFKEELQLSEEQFQLAFHSLAGSSNPTIPTDWSSTDGKVAALQQKGGQNAIELETMFKTLFNAPKCFFMTKSSGLYGIAPRGVKEGDKLVFLFPPLYMAFVLRPHGDTYRMLGPCFVPPRARDRFMDKQSGLGRLSGQLAEFTIN
jgi:hypothetical protein